MSEQSTTLLNRQPPPKDGGAAVVPPLSWFPMAGNTKKGKNSKWHWTNEMHVHFLNSMEASFVRSMFGNNSHSPPLDRYLPDSSESTQDLEKGRRVTEYTSANSSDIAESDWRTNKKKRMLSSPKISSKDQVVPQVQNRRDDDNDKDENDVVFGTVH